MTTTETKKTPEQRVASFTEELLEAYAVDMRQKLVRSWILAPREERKRRLAVVRELAVLLAKIQAESIFATAIGELAIEGVIVGDWKMVGDVMGVLRFPEDGGLPVVLEARERWKPFVEALARARQAELLQNIVLADYMADEARAAAGEAFTPTPERPAPLMTPLLLKKVIEERLARSATMIGGAPEVVVGPREGGDGFDVQIGPSLTVVIRPEAM